MGYLYKSVDENGRTMFTTAKDDGTGKPVTDVQLTGSTTTLNTQTNKRSNVWVELMGATTVTPGTMALGLEKDIPDYRQADLYVLATQPFKIHIWIIGEEGKGSTNFLREEDWYIDTRTTSNVYRRVPFTYDGTDNGRQIIAPRVRLQVENTGASDNLFRIYLSGRV